MDIDAYVSTQSAKWARLDTLMKQRSLNAAEADEFLDLYQDTSTHLSVLRSSCPDPQVITYVSSLLARARVSGSTSRRPSGRMLLTFVGATFPAALYRLRYWWLGAMAFGYGIAIAVGVWAASNPEAINRMISPEEIDALVNTDFENYYSEFPHDQFATLVWVNNAWVSAIAIAFGVLGLPVLYVLWQNMANLGLIGALMFTHDRGSLFLGLITPHGLLELTAVFVACGTGLSLFWSWIEPGSLSRMASMARAGRVAIMIALGLVGVLFVSGMIEGFVTPSDLPTWARVGIGVVAEVAFLAYVFIPGRRAARAGVTGDLGERSVGAALPQTAR